MMNTESNSNTVYVYWNSSFYRRYGDTFIITLWKIVVNLDQISSDINYWIGIENKLDTSKGIQIDDNNNQIIDSIGSVYKTEEVVMQIPLDLYNIFCDLKLFIQCSFSYSTNSTASAD